MKVTLGPGEQLIPFQELEEMPKDQVFGYLKRKEDPNIKALLTWNPEEATPSKTVSKRPQFLTESRDAFRGYFYSADKERYFRLRPETSTPHFNPESLAEEGRQSKLSNSFKVTDAEIGRGLMDQSLQTEHERTPKQIPDTSATQEIKAIASAKPQGAKTSQQSSAKDLKKHSSRPSEPKPPSKLSSQKDQSANQRPKSAAPRRSTKEGANLQKQKSSEQLAQTQDKDEIERKKRQDERIKKMMQTTRWLPDSAFTTYFGKPAFGPYGYGNTKPTYGGLMYGNYLATHNIAPHEDGNKPDYAQVYSTAELYSTKRAPRAPEPPRKCKEEDRLSPEQVEELKKRQPIFASERKQPSKPIIKPDLYNTKRFMSEHNTPNQSVMESAKSKTQGKSDKNEKIETQQQGPTITFHPEHQTQPQPQGFPSVQSQQVPHFQSQDHYQAPSFPAFPAFPAFPEAPKPQPEVFSSRQPLKKVSLSYNPINPHLTQEPTDREICEECNIEPSHRVITTTYKDMTSNIGGAVAPPAYEPYRYCKCCRRE
jgi:hypothetical protein